MRDFVAAMAMRGPDLYAVHAMVGQAGAGIEVAWELRRAEDATCSEAVLSAYAQNERSALHILCVGLVGDGRDLLAKAAGVW